MDMWDVVDYLYWTQTIQADPRNLNLFVDGEKVPKPPEPMDDR